MKIFLISSLLVVTTCGGPVQQEDFQAIIDTVIKSGAKWKAGNNFANDTTISSLKRLLGVKKQTNFRLPNGPNHPNPDSAIPEHFDSRDHWPQCPSIKHIRDQGNCASCWAVAAAGAFTDRLCIATNGSFMESLSQEELLSCCHKCGDGCNGGYPARAWNFFRYNGIVTGGDYQSNEGCQPYEITACTHRMKGDPPSCFNYPEQSTPKCESKCTNPSYSKTFSSDHHKVKRAYSVRNNAKVIQKEIMTYGPVEAIYSVYADFLTYESGVYHHVIGGFMGRHAVKIIGWGIEDGTPYWLVANQWRDNWGEKGLFRILRGNNECGFESEVVTGIPKV